MLMPGRHYNADKYRFGFNGKEHDTEWKNTPGAIYDYGFRIYDPRIAKFLSVDPLTKDYPFYTPYQFAGNMPIIAIDLDGLEPLFVITGVTEAKSVVGQTGHWKGQYYLYRVEIYEDMHPEFYREAYNKGTLRAPDATTLLARDAWNNTPRTQSRYSTNNELPPGEGFLNYWPGTHPNGSFKLYFGTSQKGDYLWKDGAYYSDRIVLNGSGDRKGVAIHKWSPHDAQGCNTTGSNQEQSVDDFVDLSPGLQEHEYGYYINEERPAEWNSTKGRWEGLENYDRPVPQYKIDSKEFRKEIFEYYSKELQSTQDNTYMKQTETIIK